MKPLCPLAVEAARRVHAERGVRCARDIHPEAIAARYGAMVLYGPVATARASIVRAGDKAVVWVDERSIGHPRAWFTIAHELGHHLLHRVVDHFTQCEAVEKRSGSAYRVEGEANDFAAEFLIPELLGAACCAAPRPTWGDVARLARTFRTSLEMSAIRFVELAPAPCAVVMVRNGRIKYALESRSFPGKIVKGREPHRALRMSEEPREVAGEAWGGDAPVVEHAIAFGRDAILAWVTLAA